MAKGASESNPNMGFNHFETIVCSPLLTLTVTSGAHWCFVTVKNGWREKAQVGLALAQA